VENLTISKMLSKILSDLKDIGEIQASAIFSNDGLIIASDTESCDLGAEIIGAMVAMIMRSAEHTARKLDKGEMEHLLLRTTEGNIFSMKAGSNAILTVLIELNGNEGLILLKMKKACEKIKKIL